MKFRPLHDRVLVKHVESEGRSAGGLIIPDSAKEKPQEAEVIAVGAGRVAKDGSLRPVVVKAGDRVLLAKWGGEEVKIDGEAHIIVREEDILAVVER